MESTQELRERQRVAERAAAAPYVDYPPDPGWYAPLFGVWAAVFVLVVGLVDSPEWRSGGLLVLALACGVIIGWQRRRRGTWPRGKPPAEIRRVGIAFVIGAAVVIGVGALLLWLTPTAVAALVSFVIVTAGVWWYDRAYARAADRTRERLGAAG